MNETQRRWISRAALALIILLSGIAFVPFAELAEGRLDWKLYAGVYQPDLDVNHNKGFPGSAFLYTGTGYPPNAVATVYNGANPLGTITTAGDGTAVFLIQTRSTDPLGRYFITLATDPNTSATKDFDLEDDEPVWPPPPGYNGPIFYLDSVPPTPTPTPTATPPPPGSDLYNYLPAIIKD